MSKRFKRRALKYLKIAAPFIGIVFIFSALFLFIYFIFPPYKFMAENNVSPSVVFDLILDNNSYLKTYKGRTNIAILGISGGGHEGYDLTDTIIFLSIDIENKSSAIISIPRDIWLDTLKARINTAYHYGEERQKRSGLTMAKAAIEEVVGVPVFYGWVIDFSGVTKIVDMLGGINVYVENGFTDKKFPIPGKENDFCGGDPEFSCRFETIHFDKGWQFMDGERVLKYIRSRNAESDEGTDFARSKRQQQVIFAVKDKLFKRKSLTDISKIRRFIEAFNQSTITDMAFVEKLFLAKVFLSIENDKIESLTLNIGDKKKGTEGFLVNPPLWQYDGAWVLVPRSGSFEEIHKYIKCHLEDSSCQMRP